MSTKSYIYSVHVCMAPTRVTLHFCMHCPNHGIVFTLTFVFALSLCQNCVHLTLVFTLSLCQICVQ